MQQAVAQQVRLPAGYSIAWSGQFEYLERAKHDVMNAGQLIALAEAVLLARFGDPETAEAKLVALRSAPIDPRETWRVTLFRALAAFRRGDPAAGVRALQRHLVHHAAGGLMAQKGRFSNCPPPGGTLS